MPAPQTEGGAPGRQHWLGLATVPGPHCPCGDVFLRRLTWASR